MQSDDSVGVVLVEQTLRDHRLGAFDDLFRRLEDEHVAAAEVCDAVDQRASDTDHDRHVRVVPARVHPAVDAGMKVDSGLLLDGQRVDVGTEHHRLAWPSGLEHRDCTRLGGTGLDVEAHLVQPVDQIAGGFLLAEADLGIFVEIAALFDYLVEHRFARQRCCRLAR